MIGIIDLAILLVQLLNLTADIFFFFRNINKITLEYGDC